MIADLNILLKEIRQDMESYRKMFEDERVSISTQTLYMGRYNCTKSLCRKIEIIVENNK